MNHHRPLTPLELALLRAVVDLGDEARGPSLYKLAGVHFCGTSRPGLYSHMVDVLWGLFHDGYLTRTSPTQLFWDWYWRPAFDLTDILAAAGAGGDGDDDKETR